ncbi:MAG: response regulator [Acidobacteria bacterium]|nr:response regulator [Acidobacteriota bacterium]
MPRLLLVDDNPSIHRIAESLLTGTSVDLVCVESGEEALRRINGGEHFDVALLDTVLGPGGMDGWALLDRLRQTPATAKLPIALMAGVLDAVDPLQLEKAPIQGFLRKPIELRDLEERLRTYMAAPVEGVGRGTVPGAKLQDWMSEAAPAPAPAAGPEPEGDLLVLTAEDLLDPESQPEFPAPEAEPELHLEELDLDTLHGATLLPPAAAAAGAIAASGVVSTPEPAAQAEAELPSIPSLNLDEPLSHEMLAGLAAPVAPAAAVPAAPVAPTPAELPEMELETLHGVDLDLPAPPAATPAPAAPVPAAAISAPAPMGEGAAHAAVQAILSDPAAREALIKALLAQGGEQVLREVAWEVMPDLASKLQK